MNSTDGWIVLLYVVLAVSLFAWFASRPEWRRLTRPRQLELWRFASRQPADGPTLDTSRVGEVSCAFCAYAHDCDTLLDAGSDSPVQQCPNRRSQVRSAPPMGTRALLLGVQVSERVRIQAMSQGHH